jgi:hypothetical protein
LNALNDERGSGCCQVTDVKSVKHNNAIEEQQWELATMASDPIFQLEALLSHTSTAVRLGKR